MTYCVTPEYLVVFSKVSSKDVIYRIDLNSFTETADSFVVHTLYEGTELNFHTDRTYDTLYYEENANIKKVYWCEDWREDEDNNNLRFINIITPGERFGGNTFKKYNSNEFEFYPVIGRAPRIKVQKTYDQDSDFPSGVVQYFFTYYNTNGAETKICQDSPLILLTSKDRGSKVDEKSGCAVSIKIYDYSTDFDYLRIYSAVRSSLDGAIAVHIVADLEIQRHTEKEKLQPLSFIDNYRNQEQIEATQLYFIGGTPIAAKTIDQKQGTLFAGNISTSHITLPSSIKDLFGEDSRYISNDGNHWSKLVKFTRRNQEYLYKDVAEDPHSLLFWDEDFTTKEKDKEGRIELYPNSGIRVSVEDYLSYFFASGKSPKGNTLIDSYGDKEIKEGSYIIRKKPSHTVYKQTDYSINGDSIYPYTLSISDSNLRYTGFKFGEIYRFGLQFQDKRGQWTEVVYIGDGECRCSPAVDTKTKSILYTNAVVKLPQELIDMCKEYDFVNYKLLFADPELSNGRNIVAQGILCPTIFSPLNRYMKTNWTNPSWSFRPVNGDLPYHHFQRLAPYWDRTAEVANIRGDETISSLPEDAQKTLESYKEQAQANTNKTNESMNKRRVCVCIVSPRDDSNHVSYIYLFTCVMSKKCYDSNFTLEKDSIQDCKLAYKKVTAYSSIPDAITSLISSFEEDPVNWVSEKLIVNWEWDSILDSFVNNHYNSIDNLAQIAFLIYANDHKEVPEGFAWSDIYNYQYFLENRDRIINYDNAKYLLSKKKAKESDWVKKNYVSYKTFTTNLYTYDALSKYLTLLEQGFVVVPTKKGEILSFNAKLNIQNDFANSPIKSNEFNLGVLFDKYNNSVEDKNKVTYNTSNVIRDIVFIAQTQYTDNNITLSQSKQISTYMNNDAFFVDTSVITFNTPDTNYLQQLKNNCAKLSIVGASYINNNYARRTVTTSVSMMSSGGVQDFNSDRYIVTNSNKDIRTLAAEYSLLDNYLKSIKGTITDDNKLDTSKDTTSVIVDRDDAAYFMTHLWEMSGSITGIESGNSDIVGIKHNGIYKKYGTIDNPNVTDYSVIKSNYTYNYKIAEQTSYVIGNPTNNYITGEIAVVDTASTNLNVTGFNTFIYSPSVDKVILGKKGIKYVTGENYSVYPGGDTTTDNSAGSISESPNLKSFFADVPNLDIKVDMPTSDVAKALTEYVSEISNIHTDTPKLVSNVEKTNPVRISYNTTPHCVFSLGKSGDSLNLLPVISKDKVFNNSVIYTGSTNRNYYSRYYKTDGQYPWALNNGFDYKKLIKDQLINNFCELTFSNVSTTDSTIKNTILKKEKTTEDKFVFDFIGEGSVRKFVDKNANRLYGIINEYLIENCDTLGLTIKSVGELKTVILNKNKDEDDATYDEPFIYIGFNIINDYSINRLFTNNKLSGIKITYNIATFSIKLKRFYTKPSQGKILHVIEYDVIEDAKYYYNGSDVTSFAYGSNISIKSKSYYYYDLDSVIINELSSTPINADTLVNSMSSIRKYMNTVAVNNVNGEEEPDVTKWLDTIYTSVVLCKGLKYNSDKCDPTIEKLGGPMFYIGELRRGIPHNQLYGGFSESALQNLTWLSASDYTPIENLIYQSIGDTYFQRYDCLKTYPADDENVNKVTDIASVMIETHQNLDARVDVNRWNFNTQVRPDNFCLFNDVYNQKNNIFTGSVLPELVNQTEFKNTYVWSLNKNYAGKVDSWTNLSTNSSARTKSELTKIVSYGKEILYALEHNGIEMINFKERNLINTTAGMQINVDFNDKVYTLPVNLNYGTHCSNVLVTDLGVYFVDDNKNTIVCLGADGNCVELPIGKMDSYFKDVITISKETNEIDSTRFFYDSIHKDVYIIIRNPKTNASECIVYNEILKAFTSFIDAPNLSLMLSFGGKVFAFNAIQITDNHLSQPSGYTMFEGTYNQIFDSYVPYSIDYRVNPNQFTDKVFTNVEFLADLGVSKDNSTTTNVQPFDNIRVWNEYQDTGVVPLQYERSSVTRSKVINNLQQKFRTWRALVPRDKNNQRALPASSQVSP